ncbi:MAG: TRAP transporter substrate-binding protein [Acetobacteraceae bacterium]
MRAHSFGRRSFVRLAVPAATITAVNILHYRADAAEFNYRFANNEVLSYPMNTRMQAAAQRLRERSSGQFDLKLFPAGQLGTDTDMLSQVRSGVLQFYAASGAVLSTLVPVSGINSVGFAFANYPQVWSAMEGDLGAVIRADVEKVRLHAFEKIFDIGFRQITSSTHPIRVPDDLKGFKIRVPPSPISVAMFTALGAAPGTLNWSEVYTALQTKLYDGQENPLPSIDTGKLYEVQKYCALTNHQWDGFWVLGNKAAFAKLPKALQDMVSEEFSRAAEEDRADIAGLAASLRPSLEAHGMAFTEVDQPAFKERLKQSGFYGQWQAKFGAEAWSALAKYSNGIA